MNNHLENIESYAKLVEVEMLKLAFKKTSKAKPWYQRSDLNGLCKIASIRLNRLLKKSGFNSQVKKGVFDIESAGGNGSVNTNGEKTSRIPHYWVEIKIGTTTLLADVTSKQFCKYLPLSKLLTGQFKTPLVISHRSKVRRAYQSL